MSEKVYRIYDKKEQSWCQAGLSTGKYSKRFTPKSWGTVGNARIAINGNWRVNYGKEGAERYEIHEFEIIPTGNVLPARKGDE